MRKLLASVTLAVVAIAANPAAAAVNLLTNGSFETGDLTGWTVFGDFSFSGVSSYFGGLPPEDGAYQVYLGSVYTTGGIYQTFTDTPGKTYNVTGWFAGDGGPPSSLNIGVGSNTYVDINPGLSDSTYYEFRGTFVGTGSDTLTITSFQLPAFNLVDNFSVSAAAPEPATWALMLVGFGGLGLALRAGRKSVAASAAN
jgi:hypothetical protein